MVEVDDQIALNESQKRKQQLDSMIEESKEVQEQKRNLDEVDEVFDRDAEIFNIERSDWTIDKASDQRMVYVPKDTVIEFMKKIEDESNQRIQKYADYAARMKLKFSDYEAQSEEYYKNMLDKFKEHAKKMITTKQRELETVRTAKEKHEERMERLQERIRERNIKNFWSDQEEESEDEPPIDFATRPVEIEEYNYYRAERRRFKLEITKWVRRWREENNGRNPAEQDSAEIAMELADYNHANQQYLEVKMAMIKQNKLPFNAGDFYDAGQTALARKGTIARKTNTNFQNATDKFLQTLSQGFGAAADPNRSMASDNMISPRGGGATGKAAGQPNVYELRCNELRDEIDELHRLINENHGSDSVVASYIEQVKKKDNMIMERDSKLDNLQTKNELAEQERDILKQQLTSGGGLFGGGIPTNDVEAELIRVQKQNEKLKEQLEALTHVEAKLVAKNKNHREKRKGFLWLQFPDMNSGIEVIPEEGQAQTEGSKNLTDGQGAAQSSSAKILSSVANESEANEELKKIEESDEEEDKTVDKIQGAHVVRLDAEKDDNRELKRRLSKLQGIVRRQTLKGDALQAAQAFRNDAGASQASFESLISTNAINMPDITPDQLARASAEDMRKWIAEFQENQKVLNGRLATVDNEKQILQDDYSEQLQKVREEFAKLSEISVKEQESLEERVAELEQELAMAKDSNQAGAALEQKKRIELIQQDSDARLKRSAQQLEKLKEQLEAMKSTDGDQINEISELTAQVSALQKENAALEKKAEKFSEAAYETVTLKEKLQLVKQQLKECTAEFDQVSTKYKEEQTKRKKLLNELEDMKGKVRVYCRIRPFSKRELSDPEKKIKCYDKTDEMSLTVGRNRPKDYNFDAVFDQESTQEEVFEDCDRLIQSAVDGYNVIIFAYGQTGSGKTFTIQGNEENPGLTPRAIVRMFDIIREMTNFRVKLKCYMVELYLSQLRDLLLPPGEPQKDLEIKEQAGKVVIQNVTEVEIVSVAQCEEIFTDGLSRRKVRATQMNDASSRSHLVFSIIIDTANINTGVRNVGKLTFVDLAGSEKSSKTGVDKQGQEEANAINMSLTALGNVIQALSEGAKFIPYRNHVLTKLMKDSLGGTAKTLMFVNCSPSVYNEGEMKNSLDYATRVKKIKNSVAKNTETKETLKLKKCIADFESQMDQMKELLMQSDQADAWRGLEARFIDQYERAGAARQ